MNERIKELAKQAGWDGFEALDERNQKFAELIVRECASLAKTKADFIVERSMEYAEDTGEETSAKATAWQFLVFEQEIKKYFGVQ